LHARQTELATALGDSDVYEAAQKERLHKLLLDKAELDKQLAATEERWLEISEEIEQASCD
jgi:ATP-binding cassette subfamily F protein 3